MIVVIAALTALPEMAAEVEAIALAHVRRSRTVAGCIGHEVARDVENPLRFVFHERWTDLDAVAAHSLSEETRATMEEIGALILADTMFDVFEATQVTDR